MRGRVGGWRNNVYTVDYMLISWCRGFLEISAYMLKPCVLYDT